MRTSLIIPIALAGVCATLAACQSQPASLADIAPQATTDSFIAERTATMWVKGMTCPFCASNLETYMAKIDGLEKIDADLATGRVLVQIASFEDDTESVLRKAVDDSGFSVDRIEFPR